jgi:hypothetical protein
MGLMGFNSRFLSLLSLGKLIGADNGTLATGHLPNRSKVIGSNPTLVHLYLLAYFSDPNFLFLRIKIGLAFGTNIAFRNSCAEVEKQTLRRMADLQDRVPCHSLAPETSDRNRSEEPVLSLPRYRGDAPQILETLIFLSLKEFLSLSLSLSLFPQANMGVANSIPTDSPLGVYP